MNLVWKSTEACDPNTGHGRQRIKRSCVHADKGNGFSLCGHKLAPAVFQQPDDVQKCCLCERLHSWKREREQRKKAEAAKIKKLIPAMSVILAALEHGFLVEDSTAFTFKTTRGEIETRPILKFYKGLMPESKRQWCELKFKTRKVLTIK